eukprot:243723-Prorocentrum_minimum.AAC.1
MWRRPYRTPTAEAKVSPTPRVIRPLYADRGREGKELGDNHRGAATPAGPDQLSARRGGLERTLPLARVHIPDQDLAAYSTSIKQQGFNHGETWLSDALSVIDKNETIAGRNSH